MQSVDAVGVCERTRTKLGRFVTHRIMKKLKNISKEQDGLTIPKVNIWVHPR